MKRALATALLLAGCSRDLTVPPDPQPGRVTGRVVYAVPGRSDLRPAGGASITLLGSSLAVTANQAGTFTLAPLELTRGVLLFRFDSDGDGVLDRQRVERLEDWNTGPFEQVDMGDVALGENASIHGRVFLADKPGAKSGLSGSAVFVPEGPFTAYTADDGSYALPSLPPGPIQIAVFRAGYAPQSLGAIDLRPAEDFGARDVVLALSPAQGNGALTGALAFSPSATGQGDSAVRAGAFAAAVADDLGFRIDALPSDLYTVTATRTGYTAAQVPNVLVLPGQTTALRTLLVTDQPVPDAGNPPAGPDGGPVPDAGTPDAGTPDAGGPCIGPFCKACTTNAQCALTEWCDAMVCVPQCSPSVPCTNGRVCDSATKTCVVPCDGGCMGLNQVCAANVCRSACDGSFPCPAGQVCGTDNACGPECSATVPCAAQHLTCSGGQCVPKPTCVNDYDCASTHMCLVGMCTPRPTTPTDAGVYPCNGACQCRLGEWCTGGSCAPDLVPTVWFAADGGGNGATRSAPAGNLAARLVTATANTVLGLRDGDRFYSDFGFPVPTHRITLAGGFVDCGDDRWVRSDTTRSILASDAGVVVSLAGTTPFPIEDVALSNLKLQTASAGLCSADAIAATDAMRFTAQRVEGGLEATNDCSTQSGTVTSLVGCTRCTDVLLEDLHLKDTATRKNVLAAVDFVGSSGTVRRLVVDPPSGTHATFIGVQTDSQIGALRIEGSRFPEVTAGGAGAFGIDATNCQARPLIVTGNTFSFARSLLSQNTAAGVNAGNCLALEIRDNLFDGSQLTGPLYPGNSGVALSNPAGVVERNTMVLPKAQNSVAVRGVFATGSLGGLLTVRNNLITGGGGTNVDGIHFSGFGTLAVASGNTLDVGPGTNVRGLALSGPSFRVSDNFSRATGNGGCGGFAVGLSMNAATGVLERNRLFGRSSVICRGLSNDGQFSGFFELYASHLWAGPSTCNGESTAMLVINQNAQGTYLAGNTFDAEGTAATNTTTAAVGCAATNLFAHGNVLGSGGGPTRSLIATSDGACSTPARWTKNYFFIDHPSAAPSASDGVNTVVTVDAGVLDPNGNVLNGSTPPFDPTQPTLPDGGALPRHRPAGAFVVDRPPLLTLKDGTDLWLDLDRRPRDAGAGPDLGCCERY